MLVGFEPGLESVKKDYGNREHHLKFTKSFMFLDSFTCIISLDPDLKPTK